MRSVAVSWIEKSGDDELADYLPQLVQVGLIKHALQSKVIVSDLN